MATEQTAPPSGLWHLISYGRRKLRMGWRRWLRASLLSLPLLLLPVCAGGLHASPPGVRTLVGVSALGLSPGYALLHALGLDPLHPGASAHGWSLVVPLSLSVDAVLGTLLAATALGLSPCRLAASLSLTVLIMVAVGWRR